LDYAVSISAMENNFHFLAMGNISKMANGFIGKVWNSVTKDRVRDAVVGNEVVLKNF
jgi:hypothetical protein